MPKLVGTVAASDDGATVAYVTTQVGLYVPLSTVTTKGDLLAATASATLARLAAGGDGTAITADSSQTTGLTWLSSAIYGDGSDGVVNFDGTSTVLGFVPSAGVYTLTRDVYLDTGSQVSGSAVVAAGGYRIYCRGTFTVGSGCTVRNNGATTAVQAGGGAPAAATVGMITTGGGAAGGSNAAGGQVAAFTFSVAAPYAGSVTCAKGGAAATAGTGNGTTATHAATCDAAGGSPHALLNALTMTTGANGFAPSSVTGYSGGIGGNGGDGGAGPTVGGGGGGGAGVVWIAARRLVNSGTLQAKGGAGANGVSGTNAGGGGGGSGGGIVVVYAANLTIGTTDVTGGSGGSGRGTGGAGATGSAGQVWTLQAP